MIQIRKKTIAPIPHILQTKGRAATNALNQRYDNGERDFAGKDFDNGIYGHPEVKDSLVEIQDGKCCFCESKIRHISPGDVEHFRPKAGWVQDSESMNRPGYYWLAYDWDNLLLSCQVCNQRNKKNYFPLTANSTRALSHHANIGTEQFLFIHPANENPEILITFKEEIPVAIGGNVRGRV
jgi:uncharacterized protein (TIGR02646 family)